MKISKYAVAIVLCLVLYSPPPLFHRSDGGLLNSILGLYPIYIRPIAAVTLIYIGICLFGLNRRFGKAGGSWSAILYCLVVGITGVSLLLLALIPYVSSFVSLYNIEIAEMVTHGNLVRKAVDNNIIADGRKDVARILYYMDGEKIKYLDNNNVFVNYEPSPDEISKYEKRRPEILYAKKARASAKTHFAGSMVLFLFYSIFLAWKVYGNAQFYGGDYSPTPGPQA